MDYYRRYVADYLSKTVALSMAEDGAYGRMLDWYYANERPLPKDIDRVFALTRARTAGEKKAVIAVLAEHFTLQDDGYHNRRADSELGVAVPKIEKMRELARENGKKGGRKPGTKTGTEIGSLKEPILEPKLVPEKNQDGSIRAGLKHPPTASPEPKACLSNNRLPGDRDIPASEPQTAGGETKPPDPPLDTSLLARIAVECARVKIAGLTTGTIERWAGQGATPSLVARAISEGAISWARVGKGEMPVGYVQTTLDRILTDEAKARAVVAGREAKTREAIAEIQAASATAVPPPPELIEAQRKAARA